MLSHIGLDEFGLWTLIMAAVAYITVFDPGFGDLITRYGARAHLEGNPALAARLCSVATLAWLGIGIVFLPVVLVAVPLWLHHKHLHSGLGNVAEEFFYWGYAYTIAGCVTAILSARLTAIGQQWLVTIIDAATRVIYAGVLLGLLFSGAKLSALVIASSVQLGITFVVTLGFVWRRAGAPYGNPFALHGALVREATRFGGWLQLGGVLELLTYETDAVVISTFTTKGLQHTGTYGLAQRAAGMTTYFGFFAQSSMLAAISAAYAAGEGLVAMRRMYRRSVRLVALCGGFIGGALLGMAPVFMAFWLGHYPGGVGLTDAAVCLAVAALLIGLPRPATAATIMAMGRVGLGVRAQLAAFCINLVLTILLVGPLGMIGVMLATVVAKAVATSYLLVRFHRLVEGSAHEMFFSWANKLILAIGLAAGASRLVLVFLPLSVSHARGPAALALLVLGHDLRRRVRVRHPPHAILLLRGPHLVRRDPPAPPLAHRPQPAHPAPGRGGMTDPAALGPTYGVVVPTFARPHDLARCLDALGRQRRAFDEIVVATRADDPEAARVARDAPTPCTVLEVVAHGALAAMAAGARATRADVICFTDDDAVPPEDWLERLAAAFEAAELVGGVGGRDEIVVDGRVADDEPRTRDVGRVAWFGRHVGGHHLGEGPARDVAFLKGVNCAYRRRALGLPVGLRGSGAQVHFEVAVGRHAHALGYRLLYDPTITVAHLPATRQGADQRDAPTSEAVRDAAYNLVVAIGGATGLVRVAYATLVGDRGAPGVARALLAFLRGDAETARRLRASVAGSLEGGWAILRRRGVRYETFD